MAEKFSGALQLTGFDDYLQPSQACIKPILVKKDEKPESGVRMEAVLT